MLLFLMFPDKLSNPMEAMILFKTKSFAYLNKVPQQAQLV